MTYKSHERFRYPVEDGYYEMFIEIPDGCVHITRKYMEDNHDYDYIHICEIAHLKDILDMIIKKYDEGMQNQ